MGARDRSTEAALEELRAFGLTYPGAHTKSPWPGHLDLAVRDKTFAYLSAPGDPFAISCKLPHSAEEALALPFASPTGYGLGKSGWVSARFTAKDDYFAPGRSYYLAIKTEKIDAASLITFVQDGDKFKLMPFSMRNKAFRGIELKEERVAPMGFPALGVHYFRLEHRNSAARLQDIQNEKAAAIVWMGRDHDWSGASFTLYITKT